jgi:hypothetical protein
MMHLALSDDWVNGLRETPAVTDGETIKTNLDSTLLGEKTMKSKHWIRSSATASLALALPLASALLWHLALDHVALVERMPSGKSSPNSYC